MYCVTCTASLKHTNTANLEIAEQVMLVCTDSSSSDLIQFKGKQGRRMCAQPEPAKSAMEPGELDSEERREKVLV